MDEFNFYEDERKRMLSSIESQNESLKLKFSDAEQSASVIWEEMKIELREDQSINFFRDLSQLMPIFETTKLYKVIEKMPKGVLQHAHLTASISMNGFLDVMTHDPRVRYSPSTKLMTIDNPSKPKLPDNTISIPQYRKLNGDDFVDKEIKSIIFLTEDEMRDRNSNNVFTNFENRFMRMGDAYYYQPILENFMNQVAKEMIADNIQAVELRNVFGLMINTDFSKSNFQQELQFFKIMKEEIQNKGLYVNFIHTGIKEGGQDPSFMDKWTEILKFAHSKEEFANIFCGFDMVGYEENSTLHSLGMKIFQLKEQIPDLNLILHAGESFQKTNKNIIDAILMGSKRIGHGVNILFYPDLINQLKQKDVCVEINMVSNFMLGYTRDLFWHPLRMLINAGVSVTINSDDCLMWNAKPLSTDFFVATIYSDLTLQEVKWLILNSIAYSYFPKDIKTSLCESFELAWKQFIKILVKSKTK